MDREQARKLIGGLFGEASDDIQIDRLESMRREIEAQMDMVQSQGLYQKMIDALDMEIRERHGVSELEAPVEKIRPQTQAETRVAGYPGDLPGDIGHGVRRDASMKWRVTGRGE